MRDPTEVFLVWKHTHTDYKNYSNLARHVLVLRHGALVGVPISELTEAEFTSMLCYAKSREARAKFTRATKTRMKNRKR